MRASAVSERKYIFKKGSLLGFLALGISTIPFSGSYAQVADNALPVNGNVVGGSASFDYSTQNELHVNQSSDRAVIDWDSFNIGENALTQFHQPGSGSIAVNRVVQGVDPTQILGTLKANGTVMVLDPNGVIFGQNSRVDVGGIVASTGTIDKDAFMAGANILDIQDIDTGGEIVINGQINVADAGLAAFVAPYVANHGVIQAKMGRVALASGDKVTLDLYGDGLVEVAADDALANALIEQKGTISAEGGYVQLSVPMVENVVDNLINMDGVIEVSSVTEQGGRIVLEGGNIDVSGTLKADGHMGGGTIHVGGEYKGQGETLRAETTIISADASISANATDHGDGGEVIVWADGATRFEGKIEAKGGPNGGDGGFVETSGKDTLAVTGTASVSVSAPNGQGGEWLLDPRNVFLRSGSGGSDYVADSDDEIIDIDVLETALSGGSSITITTGATGAQDGDITVQDGISVTNNVDVTLTLEAARDIVFQDDALNDNPDVTAAGTAALNLVLNSDADANQSGSVYLNNVNINTNNGLLTIGGGADPTTTQAYGVTGSRNHGIQVFGTTINTGNGNIILNGHGQDNVASDFQYGLRLDGSTITTNGGNITINADGGNSNDQSQGVNMRDSTITTTSGTIDITATPGTTVVSNDSALVIFNDSVIEATGSGSISLDLSGSAVVDDFSIGSGGANRIGSATMTGNIEIVADTFQIADTDNSIITQGDITIRPQDATETIGLGGGSGTLNITDDELAQLSAGDDLIIGDSGAGTGNVDIDSWDLSSKTHNVEVYGNDFTVSGIDMGTGNVLLVGLDNGGDEAQIALNGAITRSATGNATFEIRTDQNIVFTAGADITATNGSLNVLFNSDRDADQAGIISLTGVAIDTNGGSFTAGGGVSPTTTFAYGNSVTNDGVTLNNSSITTGVGNVILRGHGNDSAGASGNTGILLTSNSDIETTTGTITLVGEGGDGDDDNYGVHFTGTGTTVTSDSGNISITGQGGSSGVAATSQNYGIFIDDEAVVSSTGMGAGAATITLNGTGADGQGSNTGVRISDENSQITSVHGDIHITGTGGTYGVGASHDFNRGIMLFNGADITSTGTGVNAATITLIGNAANADGANAGTVITNANTSIQSAGGDVSITGNGRGDAVDNHGILISDDADITVTNDANITLTGNALSTVGSNHDGVRISDAGTTITAANGNVTLNGTTVQDHVSNDGTIINDGSIVQTIGSGNIDITGTSAASGLGARILSSSFVRATGTGSIDIQGSGTTSQDVVVSTNSSVSTADAASEITIVGDSLIIVTTSTITSAGDLTIKPFTSSETIGIGGGSGDLNFTDAELGDLSVGGTLIIGDSAAGTGDVDIDSWDLSATTYDVEVYGNDFDIGGLTMGGGSFLSHASDDGADLGSTVISADITRGVDGVATLDIRADGNIVNSSNADIIATDFNSDGDGDATTSADSLNIILNADRDADQDGRLGFSNSTITTLGGNFIVGGGTAPLSTYTYGNVANNDGAVINNTTVTTGAGDISIFGHGQVSAGGLNQTGIATSFSRYITTSGNITFNGISGGGTADNRGVRLQDGGASPRLETDSGNITITGVAEGTGTVNKEGVVISADFGIQTNSGNIDITGTGANGEDGILFLSNASTGIQTATGDISLTSLAGDITLDRAIDKTGAGTSSLTLRSTDSIVLNSNADITATTGSLDITLNSDRDADQDGAISLDTVAIDTNGGSFTAGGGLAPENTFAYGNGTFFRGVELDGSSILTGVGDITLNGHGTPGVAATLRGGVYLLNTSLLSATSGNISLNGQATSTGNNIRGVYVSSSQIDTDTGDISLTANRAGTSVSSYGVELDNSDILVDGTGSIIFDITAGSNDLVTDATSTIGGGSATGDISLTLDRIDIAQNIQTTGDISIAPQTNSTSIGLGGGTGTLNIDDTDLAFFDAGNRLIIGDSTSGTGAVDIDTFDVSGNGYDLEIYGGSITTNGLDAGDSILLVSNGGDITLNGQVSATGTGNSIVLVAGDKFINNSGVSALAPGAGRYLVYANSLAQVTKGDLLGTDEYGQTFTLNPPETILGTSNLFIFAESLAIEVPAALQNANIEHYVANTIDELGEQSIDSVENLENKLDEFIARKENSDSEANASNSNSSCLASYSETGGCIF